MALFEIGFTILASGVFSSEPRPLAIWEIASVSLVLLGSYMNTFSEVQRKWWKTHQENKGKCYTQGLFQYAMHINYFGDVVLFTGWALLTSAWISLALPLFMLFSFIFFHIPGLDSYLSNRYGKPFDIYAQKTKKIIPWLY